MVGMMAESSFDAPKFVQAVGKFSDSEIVSVGKGESLSDDLTAFKNMGTSEAAQIMAAHGDEVVEIIEESQCGMDLEVPKMYKNDTWGEFCHRLIGIAFQGWCVSISP
jgi:hypothetical protein